MSRADRRRFDREFKKIRNTDHCTICEQELPHNSRTVSGLTASGTTVLAGECCAKQVVTAIAAGLYLTRGVDALLPWAKTSTRKGSASSEDIERALTAIQSHLGELDERASVLMNQGGVYAQVKDFSVAKNAWKEDDSAWFKEHRGRSHRLRPMIEGEASTLPMEITSATIPANHSLEILVRQVEPGARIRAVFCRNKEFEIPDQEEIIHAIFDSVAQAGQRGVIDAQEINERARQYAVSVMRQQN